MVTYTKIMKYIEEEPQLSQQQKQSLILLACKNSNKYSSLMRWICALNLFQTEDFIERSLFEKEQLVRTLIRSLNDQKSYRIFSELSEILFTSFSSFLELILDRSRKENNPQARALMVELLLRFCETPLRGSFPEDYIPGLHHKDELIRCKTCHFLYKHYGGRALSPMISEVFKINHPLSILFCKTICHFVQLHPEISWVDEVEKIKSSNEMMGQPWHGTDGRQVLLQEMQGSLSRHRFLILNRVCEEPQRQSPAGASRITCNRPLPKGFHWNSPGAF